MLEVGTGTGALTALMAERAAAVVTVEIDGHLFELASEQLIDYPHVTMLQLDALRNKNNFNPVCWKPSASSWLRRPAGG